MIEENEKLPPEALAALERGHMIEAIKIIREKSNLGLKEAKDAVEAYIENSPGLKAKMMEANKAAGAGFLRLFFTLAVLGALAYFYFGRR